MTARPKTRRLSHQTLTDDDLLRDDRLRALRQAIDAITTRRWTDAEYVGWLRHELKDTLKYLEQTVDKVDEKP